MLGGKLMIRALPKKIETNIALLDAAKKVLHQKGYSGLSTRDVAAQAGVPLSQIHYHFGSKQGLIMALFEYLNAQLLDRQNVLFGNPALKLSQQWDQACAHLDDDIASGYVRVLQELIAASWSDAEVAKVVRAGILGWVELITGLVRKAERDGVKLFYEVYGEGPETMVFIPSWCIVHSRIYKAQLPYFSERFRCITYDCRGNGKSDRPADPAAYARSEYIADALAVMDATNAGNAIVVGLSQGGLLASFLAANHPERVRAVVMA